MKLIALFCLSGLSVMGAAGQQLSAEDLLNLAASPHAKMENLLSKNGFSVAGKDKLGDTLQSRYVCGNRQFGQETAPDSVKKFLCRTSIKDKYIITYQTGSLAEFHQLAEQFRKSGFLCKGPADSLLTVPLMFQHRDMSVRTFFQQANNKKLYCLQVQKKRLPNPEKLYFADDLLEFDSQASLEFYFGKANVKSDTYYFSENQLARCTVLFVNTRQQVVFIWKDETNQCDIAHLLFGGQQKLESTKESNAFVGENTWIFRSGIKAGMSLYELRRLNQSDFEFYAGNSNASGMILPVQNGRLNFLKENIILGCMNCGDAAFSRSATINADDALAEERILFVLSIILNPG